MSLFSRYKQPISHITGIKSKPAAQTTLLRKTAEETVATYVETTKTAGHAGFYCLYYDKCSRLGVSHVFFRGGRLFGTWLLSTLVQDLNAMASKYNLGMRVIIVEDK